MALKKDAGRQPTQVAILNINFADPTAYGTAEDAIELPLGAIVTGGDITVVTAFNGTTNTLSLGDATLATRYASAVDLKTVARTALTITGFVTTSTEKFIRALLAQTGAATAGQLRIHVSYVLPGRAWYAQG